MGRLNIRKKTFRSRRFLTKMMRYDSIQTLMPYSDLSYRQLLNRQTTEHIPCLPMLGHFQYVHDIPQRHRDELKNELAQQQPNYDNQRMNQVTEISTDRNECYSRNLTCTLKTGK